MAVFDYAVIGIVALSLALGLWRGDALAMWRRAAQVCLGCIGIG